MPLKVGDPAPDFQLSAIEGEERTTIRMSDYRGRQHVLVTFHPLDWTPTWAAQVPELNARRAEFASLNAQVLDISVDSITSHLAWQQKELGKISVPMCADFYPHGDVTAKFGILREGAPVAGISERAVFLVDRQGKIAFAKLYPLDQIPNTEELINELRKLGSWEQMRQANPLIVSFSCFAWGKPKNQGRPRKAALKILHQLRSVF